MDVFIFCLLHLEGNSKRGDVRHDVGYQFIEWVESDTWRWKHRQDWSCPGGDGTLVCVCSSVDLRDVVVSNTFYVHFVVVCNMKMIFFKLDPICKTFAAWWNRQTNLQQKNAVPIEDLARPYWPVAVDWVIRQALCCFRLSLPGLPGGHKQKRPDQPLKTPNRTKKSQKQDKIQSNISKTPKRAFKTQYTHIFYIKRMKFAPLVNFSKLLVLLKSNLKL